MKRINPFISRVLQYTFTVTAAYSITMLLKSKFDFIEMLDADFGDDHPGISAITTHLS